MYRSKKFAVKNTHLKTNQQIKLNTILMKKPAKGSMTMKIVRSNKTYFFKLKDMSF